MSVSASETGSLDKHDALEAAIRAADYAAPVIREHAGRIKGAATSEKGMNDFVTEADEAAQERIIEVLKDAFPDVDILAEEGTDDIPQEPPASTCWIIDPIDGTTNFMHGIPPYAVSIALMIREQVEVAVILDVAHDELFTAVRGEGAFVNGRRMEVSSTPDLDDAMVATGFPYRRFDFMDAYIAVLRDLLQNVRGIRRHGAAAIDLARVASGRYDAFYETGLKPWDVAAGVLLVKEAGGTCTDYSGGASPIFSGQMVASNGILQEELLPHLAPLRQS